MSTRRQQRFWRRNAMDAAKGKETAKNQDKIEITPQEWQVRNQRITQRMQYVLTNSTWSDCQFLVGKQTNKKAFKAHKLLLAMSSPVFETMFYGSMPERDRIVVEDIEPDTFETLLGYIYTEAVNLKSYDLTCELYYAASKYMLQSLKLQCVQYLENQTSCNNACVGYEFAEFFEEEKLKQRCLNLIKTQTQTILTTANLNEIKLSTISMILDENILYIQSELTLFNALENIKSFLEKNDDKVKLRDGLIVLKEAVKKIRFLTLTPKQFAEGPALSDLLTESEKFAIFMNLSTPNSATLMPPDFSTCKNFRNGGLHNHNRGYQGWGN